jgi:phosphoglycolate phosphatase
MYNILLFDLDGTLTDPKIGITKSVQYALQKFGIEVNDLDQLIPFIGPPLLESFSDFYGLTPQQGKQAIQYYREYFSVTGLFENVVYTGIEPLLAELASHDRQLFVATSKPTEFAKQILEHFALAGHFEEIVGSNLDGTRGRKAEVIEAALTDSSVRDRQRVVMIGDRLHDILGAKTCGIDSIGVAYGYGGAVELSKAGATHIVSTVSQLHKFLRQN